MIEPTTQTLQRFLAADLLAGETLSYTVPPKCTDILVFWNVVAFLTDPLAGPQFIPLSVNSIEVMVLEIFTVNPTWNPNGGLCIIADEGEVVLIDASLAANSRMQFQLNGLRQAGPIKQGYPTEARFSYG